MTKILFLPVLAGLLGHGAQAQEKPAVPDRSTQELEHAVNALKEDVFKSKAQLRELEEATLRGKVSGSKGIVDFDNQAQGIFALVSGEFYLDEKLVYRVEADPKKPIEKLRVYDDALVPGDHVLTVKLRYKGSDRPLAQPFKYFQDYKFDLETTEKIPVEYGKTTIARVGVVDKGYFKAEIKERLSLQVKVLQEWGVELPE